MKEFVIDSVVTRDGQAIYDADKCMCHPDGGATSVTVALEV